MPRRLIVNADDFGLCHGVNRGIIETFERGILTSASLMVRYPAAAEAAAYARLHPELSVGMHLDLGEWVFKEGEWIPLYRVVESDDAKAVRDEIERQLSEFGRLMARPPTHLDSHQHVHRHEPVRSLMLKTAERLGVPLRECSPMIKYCGDFYGQDYDASSLADAITLDGLQRTLSLLPEGITELGCHPGYTDDLQSIYFREREQEVRTLTHPQIRDCLRGLGLELGSFRGPDPEIVAHRLV